MRSHSKTNFAHLITKKFELRIVSVNLFFILDDNASFNPHLQLAIDCSTSIEINSHPMLHTS